MQYSHIAVVRSTSKKVRQLSIGLQPLLYNRQTHRRKYEGETITIQVT